jgi:predicted O-methyltransferase YrrM
MFQALLDRKTRSRLISMHPALRASFLRPTALSNISEAEFDAIHAGGEYTTNWFAAANARLWLDAFTPDRERAKNVLEIGSWEGRSTVFLAWLFPNARITCIDTFEGGDEHRNNPEYSLSGVEARFRKNTGHFEDRLEVRKGRSAQQLVNIEGNFDFIYIDGSHFYDDVVLDTILSWKRLNPNGYMVWDDYFWSMKKVYGSLKPKLAIDQFLTAHRGNYRVLFSGLR